MHNVLLRKLMYFGLPYSERLEILGLTTLAECHARGGLIEVYKAKHDFSFTNIVFKFGRSGLNLLSKFCPNSNAKFNTIKRNCLNESENIGTNCLMI